MPAGYSVEAIMDAIQAIISATGFVGVTTFARNRVYPLKKSELLAVCFQEVDLVPDDAVRPWTVADYSLFVKIDIINHHADAATAIVGAGYARSVIQQRLRNDPTQGVSNVYNTIEHSGGPVQWDQVKDKAYLTMSMLYEFKFRDIGVAP